MQPETLLILAMACVAVLAVYLAMRRQKRVTPQDKRTLKNYEMEMKLEGFGYWYDSLLRRTGVQGAFVIHNSTTDQWYVAASFHVFDDAHDVLAGTTGPPEIARDAQKGHHLSVRIVPFFAGGRYESLPELCRALEKTYTEGHRQYPEP
jgi:hypothetical protein